jgi:hypothetical protein
MSRRTASIRTAILACLVAGLALVGLAPQAGALPATFNFAGPVFGLSARGGTLFAADFGAGIRRISSTDTAQKLIQRLPGVTDVAPLRHRRMWALTSAPRDKRLYFLTKRGRIREVANLGRYEKQHNPDEGAIDSNPFDLQAIGGGRVLVADAAGNDLLVVDRRGNIDWIATLPSQDVSTQDIKDLVGCPTPSDPDNQQICDLPDTMPAEPVSTSVAVGPDGAYYVTELKGFPAPQRKSRVWRLDPDIRHVHCRGSITTNGCTVAARNLTSLVDINFDSAGNAYVVELDEATWFAVEAVPGAVEGGTVDQCDTTVSPWDCTVFSGSLTQPMAVTFTANGTPFAVVKALKRHPEVIALT